MFKYIFYYELNTISCYIFPLAWKWNQTSYKIDFMYLPFQKATSCKIFSLWKFSFMYQVPLCLNAVIQMILHPIHYKKYLPLNYYKRARSWVNASSWVLTRQFSSLTWDNVKTRQNYDAIKTSRRKGTSKLHRSS